MGSAGTSATGAMVLVIGALESRGVEAGRDVGREGTAPGRLSAIAPNTKPTASATIHGPHRAEGRDADVRVGEERLDASAGVRPLPRQLGHTPPHPSWPVPLQLSQTLPTTYVFRTTARPPQCGPQLKGESRPYGEFP